MEGEFRKSAIWQDGRVHYQHHVSLLEETSEIYIYSVSKCIIIGCFST